MVQLKMRIRRKDLLGRGTDNYINFVMRRKGLNAFVKGVRDWNKKGAPPAMVVIEDGGEWYGVYKAEFEHDTNGRRWELWRRSLDKYAIQLHWKGVLYVEIEKVDKNLFN